MIQSGGDKFRIVERSVKEPDHPAYRIAGHLEPYLQVLVKEFDPQQVILFGSHAYGSPSADSDVDLLVVMPVRESRVKDKVAIRRAWWPVLRHSQPLSFDLLLATPEEYESDTWAGSGFHAEIKNRGLRLV